MELEGTAGEGTGPGHEGPSGPRTPSQGFPGGSEELSKGVSVLISVTFRQVTAALVQGARGSSLPCHAGPASRVPWSPRKDAGGGLSPSSRGLQGPGGEPWAGPAIRLPWLHREVLSVLTHRLPRVAQVLPQERGFGVLRASQECIYSHGPKASRTCRDQQGRSGRRPPHSSPTWTAPALGRLHA